MINTEEILNDYRIDEGIFILGLRDEKVTVYSQQIRSLNLIYALKKEGHISENSKIAIIGGGIAGVTAAAAALSLGTSVSLYEQRPILCHLQHGCHTRWIHPHLYNWPLPGAENPMAGVPLVNWIAGPAAVVSDQILGSFNRILEKIKLGKKQIPQEHSDIQLYLGATTKLVSPRKIQWDNSITGQRGGIDNFDVIILAIGFGIERNVQVGTTPSYWRNDSVGQPLPGATSEQKWRFFISGTGDGGFIDLIRSRLSGFNQGRILSDLFPSGLRDSVAFINELRKIREEWDSEIESWNMQMIKPGSQDEEKLENLRGQIEEEKSEWLFDQFVKFHKNNDGLFQRFNARLKTFLREDTTTIFNGEPSSFANTLRLDQSSMFNAFVAYNLYLIGGFSYVSGKAKLKSKNVFVNNVAFSVDQIVFRHGTNRDHIINALDPTGKTLAKINKLHRKNSNDNPEPKWRAGWWGQWEARLYKKGSMVKDYQQAIKRNWSEPISPQIIALTTGFVELLSTIIKQNAPNLTFRCVFHRFIRTQKRFFAQQTSFYGGDRNKGLPGRVFDAEFGANALTFRQKKPIWISRDSQFDRIWQYLGLNPEKNIPNESGIILPDIKSWLLLPFFGNSKALPSSSFPIALLFIESNDAEFFTDIKIRESIFDLALAFRVQIDRLVRAKIIHQISEYSPNHPPLDQTKKLEEDREFLSSLSQNELGRNPIQMGTDVFGKYEDLAFESLETISFEIAAIIDYDSLKS
jgi:hypothetical protein